MLSITFRYCLILRTTGSSCAFFIFKQKLVIIGFRWFMSLCLECTYSLRFVERDGVTHLGFSLNFRCGSPNGSHIGFPNGSHNGCHNGCHVLVV